MPITELEDLLGTFSAEDKAALEALLERSPAAKERLISSEDVYKSLVDGDAAATARVEAKKAATAATTRTDPAARTTTTAPPPPGIDPSQLDNMVAAKFRALLDAEYAAPDFNSRIKGLVQSTANELTPGLLTQTTRTADEIYTIRNSHMREFGKELDTAALGTFIDEQRKLGKTFGGYVDAHNAFMQEERVQMRIAKGVADGLAAKTTGAVPGTTLTSGTSMAARMVQANKTPVETARGTAVDEGAKAFRALQLRHVE